MCRPWRIPYPTLKLGGGPAAQLVREGLRGPFVVTGDRAAADIVFTPRPVQDFYSLPRRGAARAPARCRALGCEPCMLHGVIYPKHNLIQALHAPCVGAGPVQAACHA